MKRYLLVLTLFSLFASLFATDQIVDLPIKKQLELSQISETGVAAFIEDKSSVKHVTKKHPKIVYVTRTIETSALCLAYFQHFNGAVIRSKLFITTVFFGANYIKPTTFSQI